MNDWGSPTYSYYVALAQLWGLMTIRIADTAQLPLDYPEYSQQLNIYLQQTEALLADYGGTNLVDLSAVRAALARFAQAAASPNVQNKFLAERVFLGAGLPRRPWYKHVVQAPGLYMGYAGEGFPGVKQPIRDRNWQQAQQQASILAARIQDAAQYLVNGRTAEANANA